MTCVNEYLVRTTNLKTSSEQTTSWSVRKLIMHGASKAFNPMAFWHAIFKTRHLRMICKRGTWQFRVHERISVIFKAN